MGSVERVVVDGQKKAKAWMFFLQTHLSLVTKHWYLKAGWSNKNITTKNWNVISMDSADKVMKL